MSRLEDYQLYLFDFDGLLVNTEELHFKAYQQMCQQRGFALNWDWPTYCEAAHHESAGLRAAIYREFPDLYRFEPCWDILYREKKKAYYDLLQKEGVVLMPGVERLLRALETAGIKRCVVTNSPQEQVAFIRQQNPILDTIQVWITREHYSLAKPHPECYLKAIDLLADKGDNIIGFEDSPRGLKALLGTSAKSVLISSAIDKKMLQELTQAFKKPVVHETSLELFCEKMFGIVDAHQKSPSPERNVDELF